VSGILVPKIILKYETGFQVTIENVGDVFLGHSVYASRIILFFMPSLCQTRTYAEKDQSWNTFDKFVTKQILNSFFRNTVYET